MNYQKHYDLLILSRLKFKESRNELKKLRYSQSLKDRNIETYFESHHIIPKCLGGTNDKSNLILLTSREHYISHWLLSKIFPNDNKLLYTLWKLSCYNSARSKKYELTKHLYIKSISGSNHRLFGIKGKQHPAYGYKHTTEAKLKISLSNTGKNNHFYGKHLSYEHKLKISLSTAGKNCSKELRNRKSVLASGKNNPMFNKHHNNNTKIKISNYRKSLMSWDNPTAKNFKYNWSQLDKIYNIWILNDKCGYGKLYTIVKNHDKKIINSPSSFRNMVKWFRNNGNPLNHSKWVSDFTPQPESSNI